MNLDDKIELAEAIISTLTIEPQLAGLNHKEMIVNMGHSYSSYSWNNKTRGWELVDECLKEHEAFADFDSEL